MLRNRQCPCESSGYYRGWHDRRRVYLCWQHHQAMLNPGRRLPLRLVTDGHVGTGDFGFRLIERRDDDTTD